jgi:hypothetical protein
MGRGLRFEPRWMPRTIHDIPLQRPEALAQALGDFIAQCEGQGQV